MKNHHVVIPPWLSKQHFFFNPQRKDSIKGLSFIQQFEKQRNALLQNVWKFNNTPDLYTIEVLPRLHVIVIMILGTTSSFHRSRLFSIQLLQWRTFVIALFSFTFCPINILLLIIIFLVRKSHSFYTWRLWFLVRCFPHVLFISNFIGIVSSISSRSPTTFSIFEITHA